MVMHPNLAKQISEKLAEIAGDAAQRKAERLAIRAPVAEAFRRRPAKAARHVPASVTIPEWAAEAALRTPKPFRVSPSLAPGCFGLAMTFRPGSKECTPCPFHDQCQISAAQNLIALKEIVAGPEWQGAIEARRAEDRRHKANSRARLGTKKPTKRLPIASVALTRETFAQRHTQLAAWLESDNPQARQLRKHKKEIMRDWILFHKERRRTGADPGPTSFSKALSDQVGEPVSVASAQKRLLRLCRLEGEGGPWS